MRLMGAARFIVIPSQWYEGQPRTVIEAFAKGAPVIASNIGAMAEMIEDGKTGVLVTPGDAGELAAKVRWALDNTGTMAEMGARGRIAFEGTFTADRNFGALMDIYAQAAAMRRGRAGQMTADYRAGHPNFG